MREINVHAMLLRAEAKAEQMLTEVGRSQTGFESYQAIAEERYATARAVRLNWEKLEETASPENRSGRVAIGCLVATEDDFQVVKIVCCCGQEYCCSPQQETLNCRCGREYRMLKPDLTFAG